MDAKRLCLFSGFTLWSKAELSIFDVREKAKAASFSLVPVFIRIGDLAGRVDKNMKRLCYGIVAGGQVSSAQIQRLQQKAENIIWIAADSGAEILWQNGVIPHFVVGDLDSLPAETLQAIKSRGETEIFRFLPEKDVSDTYLALQAVRLLHRGGYEALLSAWRPYRQAVIRERLDQWFPFGRAFKWIDEIGCKKKPEVILLGAVGSRPDHSLSNLWIVFDFISDMKLTIWTEKSRIKAYSGKKRICFKRKAEYPFFSILPLSEKLEGLSLKGFCYPLKEQTVLQSQASWLLSNQLAGKKAVLKIRRGKFLVIRSRD